MYKRKPSRAEHEKSCDVAVYQRHSELYRGTNHTPNTKRAFIPTVDLSIIITNNPRPLRPIAK